MRPLLFSSLLILCSIFVFDGRSKLMVRCQCLGEEQSSLIQFRNSLVFNQSLSTKLAKWDERFDCCSWEGVSCEEGRVTGLHLRNDSIISPLNDSSSLFDLGHLRSLDLSSNYFCESTIPARIGELTNLSFLNLSFAGFAGQVPIEISQLRSLVTLDLSGFQLKLEHTKLSTLVQNLTGLEELYLDGAQNVSSGGGTEWCHVLSSSLPRLRVLSLSFCSLTGFHKSLAKLQALSVIRLDNNPFFTPVPRFFANFSNLTTLSLKSCGLIGNFPNEIFQRSTLETLDLSFNFDLGGSLPELPEKNVLQNLTLKRTKFSGTLPTSIDRIWNLSTLDLSDCKFNGTLPSSMEKLTGLVFLDLSFNNFTGSIPSFKMSNALNQIDLSFNSFTGSIPSSLLGLPFLKEVWLHHNRFAGQLPEFPNTSSSLLEILDLGDNRLEGPIPVSIFELRKLGLLSLEYNKLNGTICLDRIQSVGTLYALSLSFNNFSVILSAESHGYLPLTKIESLSLANCKLTSFPLLRNQTSLRELDLSDNQLHGQIPSWIWHISQLNLSHNFLERMQEPYSLSDFMFSLDLSNNQLQGKVPIPLLAGHVDLSSNKFTSLPEDIGNNLNFTFFLSVSNNRLRGILPESLCSGNRLQLLDLSNNSLSGEVPKCILGMSYRLGILNLGRNNLNGSIPDAFPLDCGLMTLNLGGNFMQGKVPKSLENCAALEVLDLGNNNLRDEFPCFLKIFSSLRVLVLRSNRFFGCLDCPNTNSTWENLQIIDVAHNALTGKLPRHDMVNWSCMMFGENQSDPSHQQFVGQFAYDVWGGYYQDSVTVTIKGLEMVLVKILTIYTCIDLSSNDFSGPIPEEIGELRELYVLNLSRNAFSGSVPSILGNLRKLESLDLSMNKLEGRIPASLADLNFLSFLNLSFNQLVGRIPTGSQLRTFSAESFMGNEGLCGFPLKKDCADGQVPGYSPNDDHSDSDTWIDWNLLSVEIGFIVGLVMVVGPLMYCRSWRKVYFQIVDDVAWKILPVAVTRKWFSLTGAR